MSQPSVQHTYTFPIVIEQDEDGYYVSCPVLQGCYTQGETYEDAMTAIIDVIKLHIEDRLDNNEVIPVANNVSVTMLAVAV